MSFTLAIDGACDEPTAQLQCDRVSVMPANYYCCGDVFPFSPSLDSDFDELYNSRSFLDLAEKPRSQADFENFFDELLEYRRRDVVYISADRAHAKSERNCMNKALKNELIKFPRRNLYILSAATLSAGLSPVVDAAIKMRNAGLNAADAFVELELLKSKVRTYIVTDSLDGLKQKKLIGAEESSGGSLIKQFLIEADGDGFRVLRRSRGTKTTASALYDIIGKAQPQKLYLGVANDFAVVDELNSKLAASVERDIKRLNVGSFSLLGKNAVVLSFTENQTLA